MVHTIGDFGQRLMLRCGLNRFYVQSLNLRMRAEAKVSITIGNKLHIGGTERNAHTLRLSLHRCAYTIGYVAE